MVQGAAQVYLQGRREKEGSGVGIFKRRREEKRIWRRIRGNRRIREMKCEKPVGGTPSAGFFVLRGKRTDWGRTELEVSGMNAQKTMRI